MKNAWNVFWGRQEIEDRLSVQNGSFGATYVPFRNFGRHSIRNDRSIISTIYNRIALDVASFDVQHVRIDANGQYTETIDGPLNNCLTLEANKDQTGRAFIQDVAASLFDEGSVAVVPVDTDVSPIRSTKPRLELAPDGIVYDASLPDLTGAYEIHSLRTGKILEWFPDAVRVDLYNDRTGLHEELMLPKSGVGIIINPLYGTMNEPNGTLQRLLRKLALLDSSDEQLNTKKLDIIIQLPYVIRTEQRRLEAEKRRQLIIDQLNSSDYGIAYTDGTERITQLNRAVENNLLGQIEYLTKNLYNQLGLTQEVFDGTATPDALNNYYNRTVEPVVTAITEEFRRKFLTKTARTQGQTIMSFHNMFRLISANEMANMADSFTRNEILTSNDIRSNLGLKPSSAPQANELRNKNMPIQDQTAAEAGTSSGTVSSSAESDYDLIFEETMNGIESDISSILGGEMNV